MKTSRKTWIAPGLGLGLLLSLAGCGVDNAESMAGTKGTAAPDAPKTQADFFKQQQALADQVKSKGKGAPKPAAAPDAAPKVDEAKPK